MPQDLLKTCFENVEVQSDVQFLAWKLHRFHRQVMDTEDAENELWCAVFRAVRTRYKPPTPLIQFAKDVAYSRYGCLIRTHGNLQRQMNQRCFTIIMGTATNDGGEEPRGIDRTYELIDARDVLRDIRESLQARARKSKQFRLATKVFDMMLEGSGLTEYSKRLHISVKYGWKLGQKIREIGRELQENCISHC
jgi:hypothetical protein